MNDALLGAAALLGLTLAGTAIFVLIVKWASK